MLQESVPTQENYSQNRAVAPSQCRINNNRAQLNINASSYDGHSTGRTSYQVLYPQPDHIPEVQGTLS